LAWLQLRLTVLFTLAKAGVHSAVDVLFFTAVMDKVCAVPDTWWGTPSNKPLSAEVKLHNGLPKLQLVAAPAVGATAVAPSVTTPAVVC